MKCSNCGKVFNPSDYQIKQFNNGKNVFCSKSCGTQFRYKSNYLDLSDSDLAVKLKLMFETTDLPYDEIKKQSGVSYNRFSFIVKKYNIKRDKATINKYKKEKSQKTMLEKYGVKNPMQNEEFKQAFKNSRKKTETEELKITEKRKQTNKEKYGDENYHNVEKMKKTVQERYKVNSGFNTEYAKQRHKEASLEKYGVDNPFKSKEVHSLQQQAVLKKYGTISVLSNKVVREKIYNTNLAKYGYTNPMKNKNLYRNTTQATMISKYGVTSGFATPKAIASHKFGTKSKVNRIVKEFFDKFNIELSEEFTLNQYIYDFKYKNYLLEIDPVISHNISKSYTFVSKMTNYNKPRDIMYHYDKTQNAIKNHYKCIHIFDWDDINKIKFLIEDKQKDYAKNYVIKEVDYETAEEFLDKYSITNIKGSSIYLGLYRNDILYQLISIGKHTRSKKWEYEIFNLQTLPGYEIVGGYQKLLNYFIQNYKPISLCVYVDIAKFTRKEFEQIGFLYRKTIKPKLWVYEKNIKKQVLENYKDINSDWLPVPDCGYYLMYYKVK